MYLPQVISKKLRKNLFFVGILKTIEEKTWSGSGIRKPVYGSEDSDPYQKVTDLEHCY